MVTDYLVPVSVSEALKMLASHMGQARIIAGGTDLVLQMDSGENSPQILVDITHIDFMKQIKHDSEYIYIGAAVTHAEIASSSLIKNYARCLSLAADEVGSPQVRNAGTIGGNVINAQPAADTALALTALDAEAELVTEKGTTWAKIPSLYERPGISTVDSTSQVISRFRLKLPDEFIGSAYRRLGKCKSIALPVLCSATVLRVQDGLITRASLALGPVAKAPFRADETENFLVGKKPVKEVFSQAAEVARRESKPRDSLLRCSKLYRENLVNVLVESTLQHALGNIQERNR